MDSLKKTNIKISIILVLLIICVVGIGYLIINKPEEKNNVEEKISQAEQNKKALIEELKNIAWLAQEFYKKPKEMGAGGYSFEGFTIPSSLRNTINGEYEILILEPYRLVLIGTGKEIGNNKKENVKVSLEITSNKIQTIDLN